eukprot:4528289-Pyramimonas_sp.AAC.1
MPKQALVGADAFWLGFWFTALGKSWGRSFSANRHPARERGGMSAASDVEAATDQAALSVWGRAQRKRMAV